MSSSAVRGLWLIGFAAAVFGPVAIWLIGGGGAPVSFWDDLSVITGSQSAALLVYTLALVSRSRSATSAFGIDGMIGMHRFVGSSVLLLVLAHVFAVVADDPSNVWLLAGTAAPARAAAGTGALITLGLLTGLTRWRSRFGYETWRRWHVALSGLVLILAALHVALLARLIWSPWWRALFLALAAVALTVLAARWLWRPLRGARGFVVADVRPAGPNASTVLLRPMRGHRYAFRPGQFAWLRLRRSPWAEDHPFSMSSAPGRTVEFTISHCGDWTDSRVRELRPGRRVWLDGPHGSVTLDRATGDVLVMIATGVGIAPMLSMLRAMEAAGDGREVRLIIPPGYLFAREIAMIARRLRLSVFPILARSMPAGALRSYLPDEFDTCDVFVCGSPSLIDATTMALDAIGFPERRVHAERFGLAAELKRAAP